MGVLAELVAGMRERYPARWTPAPAGDPTAASGASRRAKRRG